MKKKAVATVLIIVIAIIVLIIAVLKIATNNSIRKANNELEEMANMSTEKILQQYADIGIGSFKEEENEFNLAIHVKNKSDSVKTFSIQIQALNKNNEEIKTETVYANNLQPGQTKELHAFQAESKEAENLKEASFKIIKVRMY